MRFPESRSAVNVEGVEQCFGKMIIVLPEGMCMGCSEGLFRQIEDLSEIQKNNLVLVVPKTIQKEFDIYNNSIYHIKNIFTMFPFTTSFLNLRLPDYQAEYLFLRNVSRGTDNPTYAPLYSILARSPCVDSVLLKM